jgi:hypothetical protein
LGIVILTPNREREWEEKEGMGFGRVEGFLQFFPENEGVVNCEGKGRE